MLVTCDRSVVFSGSSANRTDCHDITEILLKEGLKTIKPTILQLEHFLPVFTAFGQLKVGTTSPIGQVCKKVNVKPWYLPYFFLSGMLPKTQVLFPLN